MIDKGDENETYGPFPHSTRLLVLVFGLLVVGLGVAGMSQIDKQRKASDDQLRECKVRLDECHKDCRP